MEIRLSLPPIRPIDDDLLRRISSMGNYGCDLVSAILDFRRLMECDLSIGMLFHLAQKGFVVKRAPFFIFKIKKILFFVKNIVDKILQMCLYPAQQ